MREHRFYFRQPYTPPTDHKPEQPVKRGSLGIRTKGETYLTADEVVEYLEDRGAREIIRSRDGLIHWQRGAGKPKFAVEPVLVNGDKTRETQWLYLLSELS